MMYLFMIHKGKIYLVVIPVSMLLVFMTAIACQIMVFIFIWKHFSENRIHNFVHIHRRRIKTDCHFETSRLLHT